MSTQSKAIALFNQFKTEFDAREGEVASLLPQHIEAKRFFSAAVVAVKQTPDLLFCDRRSLHNAITKAAYDELIPDGREGVLIPRKEKVGDNDYRLVACWQPMVHGIRKRAGEFGLIIDAKVVCKNDEFEWEEGFEPILRHKPTPLDKDPGALIGCYAIFRRDGRVVHHEVMRKGQVLAVKTISKQQNGLMWGKFEDQAWIKTVVRRASKSVPMLPEKLQQIIERHDDDYEVGHAEARRSIEAQAQAGDPFADPDGTPEVEGDPINLDAAHEAPTEAEAVQVVTPMRPTRGRAS